MSTGYGWEGTRQVYATLLGARHVPERLPLRWAVPTKGRYNKCSTFTFTFTRFRNQRHNSSPFFRRRFSVYTCVMQIWDRIRLVPDPGAD